MINMKHYALTILSLIAVVTGMESASAEVAGGQRPNVVVIFIDDMGFADPTSCIETNRPHYPRQWTTG